MRINHTHGGNINEVAKRYGLKPEEIIDFSASINPLGMSKRARKAVVEGVDSMLHYPEQFAEGLTSEAARFYGVPNDCLIAGNGSTELIYLVPRAFKPKKALIINPTFSEYKNALKIAGCGIDYFLMLEEDGFRLRVDPLMRVLKGRYDILYICNPGNPTGTLIPKSDILEIVDKALNHDTLCIVDEAFMDFAEEESVKREAVESSNLILLRSLTKFFGIPGLRIGFAIGNKERMGEMMVYKEPWSVNALGSIAAIEGLGDTEYIEESRRYVAEERDHLFSALKEIQGLKPFPSSANYILLKIKRDWVDADTLAATLAKEGVLIRSCSSFDGLGNRFFRVAVRNREENERLVKLLTVS
ncbi:MAG: threonine-phosphate decarboxylase [Deltaproteobacteria bacterium]|nr:threonine-phosphate decarboxylase [Deltaproteobacteria bacterium]